MRKRLLPTLVLAALLGGLMAGPCPAADEEIVMLDLSWDSIQVHNRIAGYIFEHGYGREVDYFFAESMPGLLALDRGQVDVYIDGWVENQPEWWREAEGNTVVSLGTNYPNAPQGWYVPTYVIEGDPERGIEPMAPDLKYVSDLKDCRQLFRDPEDPDKGRFLNAPPGWKIATINRIKFEAAGLDEYFTIFSPGSGMALKTEALSKYRKGEPVLFYYWEPTALMGMTDMTRIRQKPPYSPELWTEEADYDCDFSAPKILKVVNKEFAAGNPQVVKLLENYSTTLAMNNRMLSVKDENDLDTEETALWFLQHSPEVWRSWIPDDRDDVLAGVREALAEEEPVVP